MSKMPKPKEEWEEKFDKNFGKFQHKNETGLFNQDDYKDFIRQLLQEERQAHPTKNGWCCACDYDIAVMEEKIKKSRSKAIEECISEVENVYIGSNYPVDADTINGIRSLIIARLKSKIR